MESRTSCAAVTMLVVFVLSCANAWADTDESIVADKKELRRKNEVVDRALDEIVRRDAPLTDPGLRKDITEEQLRSVLKQNGIQLDELLKSTSRAREEMTTILGLDKESMGAPKNVIRNTDSQLLIFVSLDMPRTSLDRAIRDARQAQGVLVLRGMKNGRMQDTLSAVNTLSNGLKSGWQITSLEYRDFGITVVPTVVLRMGAKRITACEADSLNSCVLQPWYGVEGDVSIEYALEQIMKHAPESTAEVEKYLAMLREGADANGLQRKLN